MSSASPPPKRRFLPQPVETSTRSSKRPHHPQVSESSCGPGNDGNAQVPAISGSMPAGSEPRRFLPQPVEQTTRSSRNKGQDHNKVSDDQVQKLQPSNEPLFTDDSTCPGQPTTRPARRFAPEPVETTKSSSRRKFAAEPIETSSRSSKAKSAERKSDASGQARRKFNVEPVETTTVRRRRPAEDTSSNESPSDSASESSSRISSRRSSGGRRFAPDLIETARGQYRQGKKELDQSVEAAALLRPSKSTDSFEATESRFSAAALAKRNYEQNRRHSYCVPDLPIIESDSSGEDSSPASTSTSPIELVGSGHLPKIEEHKTDATVSYTQYVLSLADRRRLQEQAMAAYINEVPYERVAHFAAEDDDEMDFHGVLSAKDGKDPQVFRRSSQDEHDLEMMTMRKHHEQLERAKHELAEDTAGISRFSAAALAARHNQAARGQSPRPKPKEEGDELKKMQQAASPPMAGGDIVFPQTISPRMTRCDVDQPPRPRRADSDDEDKMSIDTNPVLWSSKIKVVNNAAAGLWMGCCQKGPEDKSRPTTPIKSGLQTPAFEGPNPLGALTPGAGAKTPSQKSLAPKPYNGLFSLPITPPRSADGADEFTTSIDRKLELEQQIDVEFPNRVVTQIYNYLSLGYPSIARPFDEELSKISRISVEELRRGDNVTQASVKGFVGAPEGEGCGQEDDSGAVMGCRRWEALKLYVREWARQSPNFTSAKAHAEAERNGAGFGRATLRAEAWGASARRGSWNR